MRTLTRLVFWETLGTYTFNFLILTSLTSLTISNQFLRQEIRFSDFIELLPGIVISTFSFSIPLATIVSCTQISSKFYADGEILALSSGGLSLNSLLRPILFFFIILGALTLPLNHDWIPKIKGHLLTKSQKMLHRVFISRVQGGVPMVLSPNERLFTQKVEGQSLKELTYTRRRNEDIMVLQAQKGKITVENGQFVLNCLNVHVDNFSNNRTHSFDFPQRKLPLQIKQKKARHIDVEMTRPSYQLGNSSIERFERSQRWEFSLLIPLFAWLGFKLGLLIPRSNKIMSLVFSLIPIALIYYPLMMLCRSQIIGNRWPEETIWLTSATLISLIFILDLFLKKRGLS